MGDVFRGSRAVGDVLPVPDLPNHRRPGDSHRIMVERYQLCLKMTGMGKHDAVGHRQ
ncbi:MAG: hypothetical protein HYZ71_10115 [Deltaproteobacteria bacterium]|nr:hypothetical protein [Deltaproteobacteria bacterium]